MASPTAPDSDPLTTALGALNIDSASPCAQQHLQKSQDLEAFRHTAGTRAWRIGSKTWNTAWATTFNTPYSADQNPFTGETYCGYFDRFPEWQTNPRAGLRFQFAHLAAKRGWVRGEGGVWERELGLLLEAAKEEGEDRGGEGGEDDGSGEQSGEEEARANGPAPPHPFFTQYPGFAPNTRASFARQFEALAAFMGWTQGSEEWRRGRARLYNGVFDGFFGTAGTREEWRRFCGCVGIEPVPESVTQCKKALKGIHVNLVNLVEHMGNPDAVPVKKFPSYSRFKAYTLNGNIFPKARAKQSKFLKVLLEHVF